MFARPRQRQRFRGISGSAAPTLALSLNLLSPTLDPRVVFSRASAATHIVGGRVVTVASGVPRISVENGLLIEEQRTNLALNGQMTANSGMTSTGAQPDPIGGTGASTYTEDALSNSNHNVNTGTGTAFTSGSSYSISWFVKPGTCDRVQALAQSNVSGTEIFANFYLNGSGSITGQGLNVSNVFIVALNDGWYRVGFTFISTGTNTSQFYISTLMTGVETRSPTFTGLGRTITTFGPQCELGAITTSYIPTTTAAVTRAADIATMNIAGIYTVPTTFYCEWVDPDIKTVNSAPAMLDGGSNSQFVFRVRATADLQPLISAIGGGQTFNEVIAYTGKNVKAAIAFDGTYGQSCVNGTLSSVTPTGVVASQTSLKIGLDSGYNKQLNSYVKCIKLFNKRKTDAELQAMTA